LANAEGNLQVFETSGMDNAQMDWTRDGLVFSDKDNDYHLSDSLSITPSAKADFHQAMLSTGGGGSIGLYNDGFAEEGYVEQVVSTVGGAAAKHEVEGFYQVTGFCDGELYGVAEPSGKYAARAAELGEQALGDYGYRVLMLSRLTGPEGGEQVVNVAPVVESNQSASDAPCSGGILHHLASLYGSDGHVVPAIRSWNTETGELRQHLLKTVQGTEPIEVGDTGYEVGYTRGSLSDGSLEWVSSDGRLLATEVSSGRTREVFTLAEGGFDPGVSSRSVEFTQSTLTVATDPGNGQDFDLMRYDRRTGEQIFRLTLPEIREALAQGLVLRDLAVAPEANG